jgi:hypothetical protein
VVGGVRGEDLGRGSARVQETLVEDGRQIAQRGLQQLTGQPDLRPPGALPALGEGPRDTGRGRERRAVLAVVDSGPTESCVEDPSAA